MGRAISLAPSTVSELSPPDMVSCAAEAGYSHVGLRLNPVMPSDSTYPIVGNSAMRCELLARMNATGVKVLDVDFIAITPESRAADFLPMMESSARLGARHVLAGGVDPDEVRLAERVAEFCEVAASFGMTFNLEPIPIPPLVHLQTLAQVSSILSAADKANSGVVIDPIHFDRAGERVDNLAELPREWLHYMQFCDAPAARPSATADRLFQARHERMIPGTGGLDLLGILRNLPRDLPVSVEVPLTTLARKVGALERARLCLAATEALLQQLEEEDPCG